MDSVRDHIQGCGFQHQDMEHRVDGAEAVWEAQGDGVSTRLCYDLIWSQELISELLRRMGSMEKLRFDVGLTPNREFWSWDSRNVHSSLIRELCRCHVFS